MNYHPDDQAEIERLHFEFIEIDEPNNRQVMAFQDASYAVGLKRGQAREAALQQRLNEADQRVDELMRDKHRLDALGDNFWDVRHHSTALADTGDCTSGVDIIGHWMEKPHERVIGENYNENLRAAIDQAMTADAYPPARPEYPELNAALDHLTKDSHTCCVQTPEEKALLVSGDYTPEELYGAGGKPSCPKCHASPSNPGNLLNSTPEAKP